VRVIHLVLAKLLELFLMLAAAVADDAAVLLPLLSASLSLLLWDDRLGRR